MDRHETELTENEREHLSELINKWDNDPRTDQNYLKYRAHKRRMETSRLYRAKWFFKSIFYVCTESCKYLITEKLLIKRNNRRS